MPLLFTYLCPRCKHREESASETRPEGWIEFKGDFLCDSCAFDADKLLAITPSRTDINAMNAAIEASAK